jgi:hypothetical protein
VPNEHAPTVRELFERRAGGQGWTALAHFSVLYREWTRILAAT